MNGETVEGLIQKAYYSLKESDAGGALLLLHDALRLDYDHAEVLFGMKCINWWLDRLGRLKELKCSSYESGGFILSQWKSFLNFEEKIGIGSPGSGDGMDVCRYTIKLWVFSQALNFFREVLGEGGQDPEVLFHIGRCYKGVGDYDEAIRHLGEALNLKPEDAGILAEIADVNALLEETFKAKVFFREAFFLDAQGIELSFLESEMIVRLIGKVQGLGFEGGELAEWIPVYGTLWGVFSVKKELKAVELGKLKQSVMTLEGEIRNGEQSIFLKPRLLNRYFRLVDYYSAAGRQSRPGGEDPVAEIMMKIRFIDENIYEQYRK